MLWIDRKYANLLAPQLEQWKVKRQEPFVANCRCPLCGDSDFSNTKARGYIVAKGGKMFYFCHNCGIKTTFANLLYKTDRRLHDEYRLENLKEQGVKPVPEEEKWQPDMAKFSKRRHEKFDPLKELKKISSLPNDHPAKKYILSRKIPGNLHYLLYWVPDFAKWVNSIIPGKLPERKKAEGRILLPFLAPDGRMFGFQGRAIDSNSLRYISIMLDDSMPKVYGLERANLSKDTFVVEGPIDSLFLPNCVAMAGSDVDTKQFMDPKNAIYIYDNEPRNREIVKKIEHRLAEGARVVIFPKKLSGHKDINDMIKAGYCEEELSVILHKNTYSGVEGWMNFTDWKRI